MACSVCPARAPARHCVPCGRCTGCSPARPGSWCAPHFFIHRCFAYNKACGTHLKNVFAGTEDSTSRKPATPAAQPVERYLRRWAFRAQQELFGHGGSCWLGLRTCRHHTARKHCNTAACKTCALPVTAPANDHERSPSAGVGPLVGIAAAAHRHQRCRAAADQAAGADQQPGTRRRHCTRKPAECVRWPAVAGILGAVVGHCCQEGLRANGREAMGACVGSNGDHAEVRASAAARPHLRRHCNST